MGPPLTPRDVAATPMPPTARSLVESALAQVQSLSPEEARVWLQAPDVLCIDVREPAEWLATGILPGAHPVPRGLLEFAVDPASPWHRPALAPAGRRILVYCAIGWRSALAAQTLQALGLAPVAHLAGGLDAWRADGGALQSWSAPGVAPTPPA